MSVIRKLDRDPIVAFHVAYAKLSGSDPICALFLSQVSYWCSRADDGVAWITHQAMYDQTGMSRKQQDRAAAYWESVGVMKKFIKGIPPKIHYFIDYERLEQFIMEEPEGQVDMSERDILDAPNGQHVMSERGKTSSKDSKDSQRLCGDALGGAAKQQPEKAAEVARIPPELSTPEFIQVWEQWKQHRIEKKQKLTPTTVARQFAKLSSLGVKVAIDTLNRSMENGWTGIFPEAQKNAGRHLVPEQVWAKI